MSGYGYDYNEGSNYEYGYNDAYGNEYGGNGPVADEMGGGYGDFMYGEEGEMVDNMNGIDDDAGLAEGLPNGEDDMGMGSSVSDGVDDEIDFDDPRIANLPRILLMGPRRAGKTSIQRVVFHKMSPHETLFRLEATQNLERSVVDHTPLCRFTIWDFPGDYYGPELDMSQHNHDTELQRHYEQSTMNDMNGNMSSAPSMLRQPPVHGGGGNPSDEMNNANVMDLPNTVITGNSALGPGDGQGGEGAGENDGDAQIFGRATALIFVLDAQDEPYDHVLQHFTETVKRAARANPHIAIEVFINKVDGELFLSDEAKYDCRRDVMQQVTDELADAGVMPDSVQISYHLTSIYDHSVFEAFSRVVQKLIPQLPTLENLLNVLVSRCAMEKAYLFDVASKLYISTDSSPVDMQSVELCSDMIDVVLDVSGIYGLPGGGNEDDNVNDGNTAEGADANGYVDDPETNSIANGAQEGADADSTIPSGGGGEVASLISADVAKKLETGGDSSNEVVKVNGSDVDDFTNGSAVDYGDGNDELVGTLISQGANSETLLDDDGAEKEADIDIDADADTAYDNESMSVIRLSKGMVLYLKEVDTMLALVCLTRSDNFRKRNLINYNIGRLKKALRALVNPSTE